MTDRTSRRKILQAVAAIPAAGLGGLLPATAKHCSSGVEAKQKSPAAIFHEDDLPATWAHLPFVIKADGSVPEDTSKDARGYLIKLPSGKLVAYRRVCSKHGCKFEYLKDAKDSKHALHEGTEAESLGAVMVCHCHGSVFDLQNEAKVIGGPARDRPESFPIKRCHDKICVLLDGDDRG